MVKESPTSLAANIKGTLHPKQETYSDNKCKYREVQSDYVQYQVGV